MDIYSFEQILAQNLSWNRARIKFPARFPVAIFQVQTVNLTKIACVFAGQAKIASEWQLGKSWVNVLLLSISYRQVAIPLFWTVVEEKGCCDDTEKQCLIERFVEEFTEQSIRFVSADREFASVKWLSFLIERQIGFRLRIKSNARITDKRGKPVRASRMCRTLETNQRMAFRRARQLWGNQYLSPSVAKPMATM